MKRILLWVIATAMVCSCSVYHPQMADVPLIIHQGDGHVEASSSVDWWGLPSSMEGNLSASYGITNWLAVQAFGSSDFQKSAYGQAALGLYRPFGRAVIELYGGYGKGQFFGPADHNGWKQSGDYQIGYGQLDFGWVGLLDGHLDIGLGMKAGVMHPNISEWKEKTDEEGTLTISNEKQYLDKHFLLEPQLMMRTGGEHLKFTLHVGCCELTPMKKDAESVFYTPLSISAGINYRF